MGQSKNKQTKKKKRKKQHNEIKQNKTTVTTRTKKFGTITTFFIYFNYEILGQKYLNLKSSQFSLMVMKIFDRLISRNTRLSNVMRMPFEHLSHFQPTFLFVLMLLIFLNQMLQNTKKYYPISRQRYTFIETLPINWTVSI